MDSVQFKGQEISVSLGRYPDGAAWWFAMPRTLNAPNSAGLAVPVISEIMYHPPDTAEVDNTLDEYVELFNPAGTSVVYRT